jgi:hypothetical protein
MAAKVEKIPKHLSRDLKVAATELSKAHFPLKKSRDQLNISESSLHRILSFARKESCQPQQSHENACCPQPQAHPPRSAGHQEGPDKESHLDWEAA